ncbi:MAG: HAD family phosphatase [Acidobacteria bacterium]|nr:HAD family phosphatase [Acidobacteriota bacterium]
MTAIENSSLIDSVLRLRPQLAVFDCDGTLWAGDAGETFFDWELRRGVVADDVAAWARRRYADYRAGAVSEDDMCGEMVTLHKGLPESEVLRLAGQFFEENFRHRIFPEMRQLIAELRGAACDVWAVSSTNEWVIRRAVEHFAIGADRILAAAARIENGIISDRLLRVPSGTGKPKAIFEVIGRTPDAAFGNSRWDLEMLTIARHAVAVNPNPDLERVARERGWAVYWPAGTR